MIAPGAGRDPEGRKRAIIDAAAGVVADVGVGRATHRAIAARAGVPLGATTYYFPTLRDLVVAALEEVAGAARAELDTWARELAGAEDIPKALAELAHGYVADRPRAVVECELYLAAARDPALGPYARIWIDGLSVLLSRFTTTDAAAALAALLDGAIIQALVTGDDLDTRRLAPAIESLVNGSAVRRA
ncbi:MAG: TetR/AcrR family transcriptional regulator [Sciscionella sp.]